ncbi:MAG: site-specific DNA-methyltransferase [Desulfobacteraceae bacterium]|nr:site-specific DNA-methyltransferase [Desulfobacteraceae bacterium]
MYSTFHKIIFEDSRAMKAVKKNSVDLIVTSPPYPMIEMWDNIFGQADAKIARALEKSDGDKAFDLMHSLLDRVWKESLRVMKEGGILCINIGDAVRSINGRFQLFPNHSRIITFCRQLGYNQLPTIIWRKPANSPTKFMGSGMMPPGAYVTLEHEYILVFRKGALRSFDHQNEKQQRRESSYFWEERNLWFSDIWFDLLGINQKISLNAGRNRSGAFPLELAYRLINMFSLRGDCVLDPFLGSGTTALAAMCTGRNSIGYEIDSDLEPVILDRAVSAPELSKATAGQRFDNHLEFVNNRIESKGPLKYTNSYHGFAVVTRQEKDLILDHIQDFDKQPDGQFKITHVPYRQTCVQDSNKGSAPNVRMELTI